MTTTTQTLEKGTILVDRFGTVQRVISSGPIRTTINRGDTVNLDGKFRWWDRNHAKDTRWLVNNSIAIDDHELPRALSICEEHYLDESDGGRRFMVAATSGYWERLRAALSLGLSEGDLSPIRSKWTFQEGAWQRR